MSLKYIGGTEVARYCTSNGKYLGTKLNQFESDENGLIELDSYSQEEMNEIFSALPLSKYGTGDYLPPGVSGSFEGASTDARFKMRSLILEDNGDLVMLRNGTNGSSRSVYYSYLPNALSTNNMSGFISTNKKYNPAYFNNNYNALYSINSDSNVIMLGGEHKNTLDQVYMISVTNETFDDRNHRGIIVPISTFSNSPIFCMLGNTQIFVFTATNYASGVGTSPTDLLVYTIPISDVQNQVPSPVFTLQTGWTTNSFYGDVFSSGNSIRYINRLVSTNAADKPFLLYPSANVAGIFLNSGVGFDFFAAQDKNTGIIRTRTVLDTYCALSSGHTVRPKSWFNMSINLSTKVASVENLQAGVPLVITNVSDILQVSGWANIPNSSLFNIMVNTWLSYYISISSGRVYTHRAGTTGGETNSINRIFYNNPVPPSSLYEAISISYTYNFPNTFSEGIVYNSFASSVGGALRSMELLPNNNVQIASTNNFSSIIVARSAYGTPANYVYDNTNGTTTNGFAPSSNRSVNSGINSRVLISTVNSDQSVNTNGGILTEYRLSTPETFDQNGQAVGSNVISTSLSVLTALKNSMLSGVPNLNLSKDNRIALYVPRQSNIPVFAIVTAARTTGDAYIKIVEVSVNTRLGNITTATISRFVSETNIGLSIQAINNSIHAYLTGLTIYEGTDFYALMFNYPYFSPVIGNTLTWYATMKCPKNTSQLSAASNYVTSGPYTTTTNFPCAIPNHGFGTTLGVQESNAGYTRIMFKSHGTTQADYDAWTPKSAPEIIVVSQDVPEGFNIYFTQETPVIISGKTFVLPVSNVDLTTIKPNPANSIFNVYVQLDEGLVKYTITEDVINESEYSMWIGNITTDALQISSVNIEKRSRLDLFGASTDAAGSSFPVSTGIPSQPGSISW